MKEPRNASLNVVFSPGAWQTLGRISSEEFQSLQSALRTKLAVAPSGGGERQIQEVRSGNLVATYEVDPENGAVTVLALARTQRFVAEAVTGFRSDPSR